MICEFMDNTGAVAICHACAIWVISCMESWGGPLYCCHACYMDGDRCDYNIRKDVEPMGGGPSVFAQGNGYK